MKKVVLSLTAMAFGLIATPLIAQSNNDADLSQASQEAANNTFSEEEIINSASKFFGKASNTVGEVVEKIFQDQGEPVGYISGTEYSGALGVGVRYGEGDLVMKDGTTRHIFWRGPSIGFDTGANASKVFTLVYNLGNPDGIYRRYPGVEGAAFFIAGISGTYQQAEGVILAPMRTGVGFRAGANAGYTAYSKKKHYNPF